MSVFTAIKGVKFSNEANREYYIAIDQRYFPFLFAV